MNAVELLQSIIREHAPEDIWQDSPLLGYRMLGNTNRGEIGEEFIRRYLSQHGIDTDNGTRTSRTDLRIGAVRFEVKTASLGANGTFQFNHVRLDRMYDLLLCLGICPHHVVFNMWRKGAVAENQAGTLVRMAEGQAVTYKLTKKLEDMEEIENLPTRIQQALAVGNKHRHIPQSRGGIDYLDNLALLCPPCNKEKRDRMTLTGLQDDNRKNGHLTTERERNIRHGRAQTTRRRRR